MEKRPNNPFLLFYFRANFKILCLKSQHYFSFEGADLVHLHSLRLNGFDLCDIIEKQAHNPFFFYISQQNAKILA